MRAMKYLSLIAESLLVLTVAACSGAGTPPSAPASQAPASAGASQPAPQPGAAAPAAVAAPASDQPLSPPVKVTWGVSALAPEAGIFVAKEKGYFEQEGLDVELTTFTRFADQLPLLATGKLDYGTGGINPEIFNAISRDIPVRIVTANAVGTPGDRSAALLVRQDLVDSGRFKALEDLRGMKIAINSPGTSSQLILERILAKGGLTRDDVDLTIVPFSETATALANAGIDAAFTVEPFINGIVARGLARSIITGTEGFPGSINQIVVISPVFAKEQPEAAKRLMYAFLKGQREYLAAFITGTNPGARDEIIQILTRYTALKDPALYAGMGMSGGDPNGAVDLRVLAEMQDYFVKDGTLQQALDVTQVVDPSYAEYAAQRLGKM